MTGLRCVCDHVCHTYNFKRLRRTVAPAGSQGQGFHDHNDGQGGASTLTKVRECRRKTGGHADTRTNGRKAPAQALTLRRAL